MSNIEYKIFGGDMQMIEFYLKPGEWVQAEPGVVVYMRGDVVMQTGTGGGFTQGLKRAVAGESFFVSTFHNKGKGKGVVAFSPPYLGKIIALDLKELGGEYFCQKNAFLCATQGVTIEVAFKLKTGLLDGSGFILQRLRDGVAFIHAGGDVREQVLEDGESLYVDAGCLVAFSPTVKYDIQFAGGKNAVLGGTNLFFADLKGPGKVYVQSSPFSRLAKRVVSTARRGGHRR